MDVDPMGMVEEKDEKEQSKSRLNAMIAITIALLATFMGFCKVKDDNIVQAMQQAQANKIDSWGWYQARNIREEVMTSTAVVLHAQAKASPAQGATFETLAKQYDKMASEQDSKKKDLEKTSNGYDDQYNALNYHDDQFDLSDALLAIAISMLAMTALTQKKWLFFIALVPTFFGVLMGLAGVFGWHLHPDALTNLLQ